MFHFKSVHLNIMINKRIEKQGSKYYLQHLEIINPIIPVKMTAKEMEILAEFMNFDGVIGKNRFGSTARKIVREVCQVSSANLSNYIKSLITKGYIIKDESGLLSIRDFIVPENNSQTYTFKLVKI